MHGRAERHPCTPAAILWGRRIGVDRVGHGRGFGVVATMVPDQTRHSLWLPVQRASVEHARTP